MKQRKIILQNIVEAREQLESIEKSLLDPEYQECDFQIQLEHAYHHLNYAWNIRDESDVAVNAHTAEDFTRWSKFPIGEIEEFTDE